jgi:4-hydroxybenzoyl-CoA thioesterase
MRSFRYERLLHWSECDPAGVIFFPNYACWMVEGVNSMFLAFGVDPNGQSPNGDRRGLPSKGFVTRFHAPAVLHDRLIHEVNVTRIGSKSIEFQHRFLREDQCLADATETRVWVEISRDGMKAKEVPSEIRTELESDAPLHSILSSMNSNPQKG